MPRYYATVQVTIEAERRDTAEWAAGQAAKYAKRAACVVEVGEIGRVRREEG